MSCVLSSSATSHTAYFGTVEVQGAVLPIMAYTGRLHPKGVPFSGFRYMKGYGFYSLKYMKGKGNLSFGSVKGPKGLNRWILWLCKVGKTFYFCYWFLFKWQCIYSSLKGCKVLNKVCERGINIVNRGYTKGVPFSWKTVYKRVRGWTLYKNLKSTPWVWRPC